MIVIEVQLPCIRPRLKNTSGEFPNLLFGNLLSGENQTVTNLPYTVKSNHLVKNPFHYLGFIQNPNKTLNSFNKRLLYKLWLSQRVVVHNMLTLIVYQRFDQYGSRSILKKLIFNEEF
jgi:hypothetical protein